MKVLSSSLLAFAISRKEVNCDMHPTFEIKPQYGLEFNQCYVIEPGEEAEQFRLYSASALFLFFYFFKPFV